ncbi:MAG: class I SAM-dependent methyltransferase, partial [Cyanobacteria bacterium P01_C01_bin.73]
MVIQAPAKTQNSTEKPFFKSHIKAYFERMAPELDHWHQRNRYYYEDMARLHQFLIPPGSRVMELGCGTGDLLNAVAPKVGVGIDFAPAVLDIAKEKYSHLAFYSLEAETLTPEALAPEHQCFDYIILSGILSYLEDIQTTLENLHKFCHPGTRLILAFHNYQWEPILRFAEAIGQRR